MTDPNRTLSLDIIGMDVASPGCEGLAAFGRNVYRGQPSAGRSWNKAEFEAAACRSVQHVLADAGLSTDQVTVITGSQERRRWGGGTPTATSVLGE